MRTPDVPGRSAAHQPRLTSLYTLQEVVVLLLLARLLRPVEEVALGESDVEIVEVASLLSSLQIQPDPGEDQAARDDQIELGVVDDDFVRYVGVKKELAAIVVGAYFFCVSEGVAHPIVYCGHVAAPLGGVHLRLLDNGAQREGFLLHTSDHIWSNSRKNFILNKPSLPFISDS